MKKNLMIVLLCCVALSTGCSRIPRPEDIEVRISFKQEKSGYQDCTYNGRITNTGPGIAPKVVITLSGKNDAGWGYSVTETLINLRPGESRTVEGIFLLEALSGWAKKDSKSLEERVKLTKQIVEENKLGHVVLIL